MSSSIAFFDVDYTLVKGNTGYYTTLRLIKHGILKKRRLLQAAYYQLSSLILQHSVQKIYEIVLSDLTGTPLCRVLEIGRECFEADIRSRIYEEAIRQLREHQTKGDKVVLLTSAPYMLIRAFKDYLGADEAYCMGPEVKEGLLTNRLETPICHGAGKIHYAKEASKKYGIPLSQCYFYSDHHTDIPVMEAMGNPRPVNPDRKLERVAREKGWPVMRFG